MGSVRIHSLCVCGELGEGHAQVKGVALASGRFTVHLVARSVALFEVIFILGYGIIGTPERTLCS